MLRMAHWTAPSTIPSTRISSLLDIAISHFAIPSHPSSFLLPLRLIHHLNPPLIYPPLLQRLDHRIPLRALHHNLHPIFPASPPCLYTRAARTTLPQLIRQRLRTYAILLESMHPRRRLIPTACFHNDFNLGRRAGARLVRCEVFPIAENGVVR